MEERRDIKSTAQPRPVADCFKFRNKIGLDVATEALQEAWRAEAFHDGRTRGSLPRSDRVSKHYTSLSGDAC